MATFLVRMVTATKWCKMIEGEICADAITANLRTENNVLSFWACDSEEERPNKAELNDVVIALAAGRERLDKLDLVCLLEADIINSGIEIKQTLGQTAGIERIKELHRDLIEINLPRLVKLSELIHLEISKGRQLRFSKKQIQDILQKALDAKLLEAAGVNEKILAKLNR